MDLYNLLISAKLIKGGGGGGDIDVDALTVTENGVYSASSGHAYSPVTVSVPQSGITPTGTSNITANGIYDVTNFASASVAVPGASGTTNITSNGIYDIASFASASVNVPGIVPSGTSSITANGIYDITNFASVDVNVSGGGGGDHDVEDALIMKTISGAYTNNRVTSIGPYAFYNCSSLTAINFANVKEIMSCAFSGCSYLTSAVFQDGLSIIGPQAFRSCYSRLSYMELPSTLTSIGSNAFANAMTSSGAIFICKAVNPPSASANCFTNLVASIYVPADSIDAYKAAEGWSTKASLIQAIPT